MTCMQCLTVSLGIAKAKNTIRRRIDDQSQESILLPTGPLTNRRFAACRMEETKLAVRLLAPNLEKMLNVRTGNSKVVYYLPYNFVRLSSR